MLDEACGDDLGLISSALWTRLRPTGGFARRIFSDAWKPTAMSKAEPTNFSTRAKSSSVRRSAASFAR